MSTVGSIRGKTLATTLGLALLALSAVPTQAGQGQQGMSPQGTAPQGMNPQGLHPQGMGAQGLVPQDQGNRDFRSSGRDAATANFGAISLRSVQLPDGQLLQAVPR